MDLRKQSINVEQAKEMDLVDYLQALGHRPAKTTAFNYWYHSPLRDEKTPSFKVNRQINRWFDFGLGQGGNLIDFGIIYHQCSVGELLEKLSRDFSLGPPIHIHPQNSQKEQARNLTITSVSPIQSPALIHYLSERRISLQIAQRFCQQVSYQIGEKKHFGLGFRNDSGGYELRNHFSKLSTSPKDFTSADNGKQAVNVFEGFFDLMSFAQIQGLGIHEKESYLVLNSLSMFAKARALLETHGHIHLYMDNDPAGRRLTEQALQLDERYDDRSSLYAGHKDLNQWLSQDKLLESKARKLRQSLRLG